MGSAEGKLGAAGAGPRFFLRCGDRRVKRHVPPIRPSRQAERVEGWEGWGRRLSQYASEYLPRIRGANFLPRGFQIVRARGPVSLLGFRFDLL